MSSSVNNIFQVKVRSRSGVSAFRLTTSRSAEALREKIKESFDHEVEISIVLTDTIRKGIFM